MSEELGENAGTPRKEKIINRAMSVVGGAIPASALLYIGITINEAEIEHVHQIMDIRMIEVTEFMRDFRQKRILPDAEKYINAIHHDLKNHHRRLADLENFKLQGDRCTINDCQRIERVQQEARRDSIVCQTNVAVLKKQIDDIEETVELLKENGN